MKKSTIFGLLSIVAIIIVGFFAWNQRYAIYDYVRLQNYTPSPEITMLAQDSGMSSKGQNIFYVNDPQIADQATFNSKCPQKEQSIVLGCYNGREIYVYNVTEEQLSGIKEVTAAHEMLHAAYDRLSSSEKKSVDAMLLSVFDSIQDQRLKNIIEAYRKDDPSVVSNELHSIIGTEVRNLPPQLEQYYQKYFTDRSKVVSLSEQYEMVFIDAKNKADQLLGDLSLRKAEIDRLEKQVAQTMATLQQQKVTLENLKNSGNAEQYNSLVPSYNQTVKQYNQLVQEVGQLINEYNQKVADYNELAGYQQELINSIDSKYQQL